LQSYSQISALGPEGHFTSRFKRAMFISCRPCVDVHKGRVRPNWTQGEVDQKHDLFWGVINGWPFTATNAFESCPVL